MDSHLFTLLKQKIFEYTAKGPFSIEKIDERTKIEFVMLLGFHRIIPKRVPFHAGTVIIENFELFLDWYHLEKVMRFGKTAAEMYVGSKKCRRDFRDMSVKQMKAAVKELKHPVWEYFTVCRKGEREVEVKILDTEEILKVHDEDLGLHVAVGDVVYMKLYLFQGMYYVSGIPSLVDPEIVAKYFQVKAFICELEEVFSRFLGTVPREKKKEYGETSWILMEYVAAQGYTSTEEVKEMNVKESIKWFQREIEISEKEKKLFETMLRGFLTYLKEQF